MLFKIRAEILKQNKGVFYNMKIRFLRARTAIIAGLICIVTTATNGSFGISSSSRYNDIKSFLTNDTVKDTIVFCLNM